MAEVLDNAREAGLLSMATGLLLLSLLVVARPSLRRGVAEGITAYRRGVIVWWQLLGGLAGATVIAAQSIVVPILGVALFTVAIIAGQTANSLLVDRVGLGPAGRQPVTTRRIAAAGIAVLAVAISVLGKGGQFSFAPVLFVVVAGATTAAQLAVNARVGVASGEALVAAWVNFIVGFTALAAFFAVGLFVVDDGVSQLPTSDWWLYLSGPIGVLFISAAAVIVRVLGVLMFSLCVVAGQVVGAVVIDVVSPTGGNTVGLATLVGVALTVLAVGVGSGLVRWHRAA
jgi:transporter family-2 protein